MAKSRGTSSRRSARSRAATRSRAAQSPPAVAAQPTTRDPHFQAVSVTVASRPGQDPARVVAELAKRTKLQAWRVDAVDEARGEFELVPPARSVPTPGKAWDLVYRLRGQPEVVHAEPLFEYAVPDIHQPSARRARGDDDHPATANNFEWSLEKTKVIEAWTLFGSRPPGAGVTVGHPDTGYTPHPELAEPSRLLVDQGFDFDDDDANPLDDLDDGFLDNPGHGTATASVIVSNRGAAVGNNAREFVSGAAPFASLIPIRTTETVVLFSMRGLRQAIDHAVAKGVQVISMSLGGPLPSPALRNAIRRAGDAGAIVLAAAGNQVRVVVFPAAFDEVIAVAASTVTDGEWPDSCRGEAVDITAPGASVWRARVERAGDGSLSFSVKRGSGTSYAVATVAGIAALWVSFHGFAALVRRYGASNVPRVFKTLLQDTCRTPRGWDTRNFGPGIANAHALLAAPLPDVVSARKLRDPRRAAVATDTSGLEAIVHLLPDVPRTDIERALAEMLGVPDRELPRVLQEVGDELAFQMVMTPSVRAEIERRTQKGRRAGRARATALTLDREMSSARLAARLRGARP
jgi:serine protease